MPIRVAFVNGGILGLLPYAQLLRRYLADSGDVHAEFFVLTEDLTLSERLIRRALSQRLLPDRPGWRNVDRARFRRELNAGLQARRRLLAGDIRRFDVLHYHCQPTAYASLDLMRRRPAIVSFDAVQSSVLEEPTSRVERWSLQANVRRDGAIFRGAAALVSASRWAEGELRRLYPDCRTPCEIMPNPVRMDLFDRSWIDERRGGSGGRPQVFFMGGDFPRKGGPELLRAWTAGGFASRADLTLATDWPVSGLPEGVRVVRGLRSATPEWTEAWRRADLFVMPTRHEAFGMVYQEAGAAGLPAIGPRLHAIPEIISDGETGLLVTPGRPDELVAALDNLIRFPELRHRLGASARAKIATDADPVAHVRRLVGLIRRVAGLDG